MRQCLGRWASEQKQVLGILKQQNAQARSQMLPVDGAGRESPEGLVSEKGV